jgi:hypothetical protein
VSLELESRDRDDDTKWCYLEFIVVFKDNVSKADIDKYAKEVNEAGRFFTSLLQYLDLIATLGGNVGQRYDSVLNGFSATIPDSFMSQLQSLQGEGVIDYIGKALSA